MVRHQVRVSRRVLGVWTEMTTGSIELGAHDADGAPDWNMRGDFVPDDPDQIVPGLHILEIIETGDLEEFEVARDGAGFRLLNR